MHLKYDVVRSERMGVGFGDGGSIIRLESKVGLEHVWVCTTATLAFICDISA